MRRGRGGWSRHTDNRAEPQRKDPERHASEVQGEEYAEGVGEDGCELADHFGSKRVFSDVTHLRGGDVWRQTIETTIAHAKIGIVVIGKEWLTASGVDGRARLLDDTDVVRREIRALISGRKRIIVVVADALPPDADALPDDLKPLAEIQAITVTHRDWTTDFEKVLAAVRSALRPPPLS